MPKDKTSRRQIIGSLVGLGSIGILGTQSVQANPTEKDRPNTYSKTGTQGSSFTDSVYFNHLFDTSGGRKRVREYERTGRTDALLTPDLLREIQSQDAGKVDIRVQTTGRRSQIRSKGEYQRQLNGWKPTLAETRRLDEYGNIGATMSVASTLVAVSDVSVNDLSEIADLPFVLEIGHDSRISGVNSEGDGIESTSASLTASSTPTTDDLQTSSHSDFDSVSHSLGVKAGAFFAGYEDSGSVTAYETNVAEDVGLDTTLAKDFTGSGGWKVPKGYTLAYHGTDVMNTMAYILDQFDQNRDHLVPLRVWDSEAGGGTKSSDFSNAVDYAIQNDVAAGVCSLVINGNVSYCPNSVCAELESYTTAGYTMAVACGSQDRSYDVDDPAASYFTVGVGAYNDPKNDGFDRIGDSQYCTVDYYNDTYDQLYCSWCHDYWGDTKFCPDIYSCGDFYAPGTTNKLEDTSMAAPVVGAAGALDTSANSGDTHLTRLNRYHGMDTYPVYPTDTSKLGETLHVPDIL